MARWTRLITNEASRRGQVTSRHHGWDSDLIVQMCRLLTGERHLRIAIRRHCESFCGEWKLDNVPLSIDSIVNVALAVVEVCNPARIQYERYIVLFVVAIVADAASLQIYTLLTAITTIVTNLMGSLRQHVRIRAVHSDCLDVPFAVDERAARITICTIAEPNFWYQIAGTFKGNAEIGFAPLAKW